MELHPIYLKAFQERAHLKKQITTGMLGLDVRICLPQRHLDHLELKKITKKKLANHADK